jgi:transposase-like protein
MQSYSTDLRHKIVHAYERRLGSQCALADLFGGSVSFVEKLLRRYRRAGAVAPKPHAGGQQRRLAAAAGRGLQEAACAMPDILLEALCACGAATQGSRSAAPRCAGPSSAGGSRVKKVAPRQ